VEYVAALTDQQGVEVLGGQNPTRPLAIEERFALCER
jgi:hypothetical protein